MYVYIFFCIIIIIIIIILITSPFFIFFNNIKIPFLWALYSTEICACSPKLIWGKYTAIVYEDMGHKHG